MYKIPFEAYEDIEMASYIIALYLHKLLSQGQFFTEIFSISDCDYQSIEDSSSKSCVKSNKTSNSSSSCPILVCNLLASHADTYR